jgi:ABC-type Fe3+ transport system substrate-binding protein
VLIVVDLNMSDGLGDEEKVAWLKKVGEQLKAETGQESGVHEQRETNTGQPVWVMWGPSGGEGD